MAPPGYLIAGCVYSLIALIWRQDTHGVERLPKGAFVIAANHVSNIDPFTLSWGLFPRRPIHFMAKAELYNRWLGWAMRAVATFPVRRGEADAGALRAAHDLLREGKIVGMFPEGTRQKKGLNKKFAPRPHPGTARIALSAGVPLVPAAIVGTDRLLSLGRIRVAYGSPVRVNDLAGLPRKQAAEIATQRLMEAIEELAAEVGKVPGPWDVEQEESQVTS